LRVIGLAAVCLLGVCGVVMLSSSSTTLLRGHHGDATGWNNAQKIVVDAQGQVHLVFQYALTPAQDEDLFVYARSTAQGWETTQWEGRWPTLAYDGTAVWLAYVQRDTDAEEDRLWLQRINAPERWLIAESAPHTLFYPALVVANGKLYLAWEVHRDEKSAIMLAEFSTERSELEATEQVAENKAGLYFPTLAAGPDGPHLAYEEAQGRKHRIVHAWHEGDGWHHEVVSGAVLEARYPALDYDPDKSIYELVFVGYASGGNEIYYRALTGEGWTELQELSQGLEPDYWTFPVVEDGLAVWGRTVAAGCSIGPLYWSYRVPGPEPASRWSEPRPLEGEFAAFPHLFREGDTWHLIWTDRDPESPLWRVIRYRRLSP